MNYHEAFNKAINRYGLDVLRDNFLFSSMLLDLVGNRSIDRQFIDAFITLNSRELIIASIDKNSLENAKKYVKSLIIQCDRRYSVEQYIKAVEPLFFILYPNTYVAFEGKARVAKTTMVKVSRTRPAVVPQQVVTPPKAVKKQVAQPHVSLPKFDTINIVAKCRNFKILYGENKECHLFTEKGYEITDQNCISIRGSSLFINVNKKESYVLEVPDRTYKKLNVTFSGKCFNIGEYGRKYLEFKDTNISIAKGNFDFNSNITHLNANMDVGYITGVGSVQNASISGNVTSVILYFFGDKLSNYCISVNRGDIDLHFVDKKVRPRINHLFQTVKTVNGAYMVSNSKVKMALSTLSGKIKVR